MNVVRGRDRDSGYHAMTRVGRVSVQDTVGGRVVAGGIHGIAAGLVERCLILISSLSLAYKSTWILPET